MLISAVCAVKREKFYREIGDVVIHFGPYYDMRKGVINYGDEEVWNYCKDVKSGKQETGSSTGKEEDNKEIINFFSTIQKLASGS